MSHLYVDEFLITADVGKLADWKRKARMSLDVGGGA